MLDNPLFKAIIAAIIAGEETAGIAGTPIKQAFQPTQQGVNKSQTGYMFKVFDLPMGFPERSNVYDSTAQKEIHTETQVYETTIQISVLSTQDPTDTNQLTASDILNLIASILRSDVTLASLNAQGIAVIKVGSGRNTPFIDDRQRHEFAPNMDLVVAHKQIVTTSVDVVQSAELEIESV